MVPTPPEAAQTALPSRLSRLGEACVFGVCVAALASVPTALRTTAHGASFFDGLILGAATLLPIVTLSIVMLRAAGRGVRGIAGKAPSRAVALRVALWIGLALPALAVLATLLKAVTHHKGLGGATFGVFGLFAVGGAAVIAYRLVDLGERLAARGVKSWVLAICGAAIGVVPVLAVAAPLGSPETHDGAGAVGAAIVDGLIAAIAMALVVSVDMGDRLRRLAGMWGVPFAALLLITATARVEATPAVGRAVQTGGGLSATLLHALESWTDRDGDGEGAHFGGSDCDEGNPARRPGAQEIAGNGVDENCDGADTPSAEPAATGSSLTSASATAAPTGTGAAGASATPTSTAAAAATSGKPDIVLLTLDSVRADHTSAYGYDKTTTPHLAELAQRGVLFERAYAAASDTQRAYAPIVTGKRLSRSARKKAEWPTFLDENDTLAERLHRSGYVTAAVTSFTWLNDEHGFDQGFDRFETVYKDAHPERGVTGPLAVRAARKILADLESRAQPIFVWVHLFDAHEKYLEHKGLDFGKGRAGAYDGEVAFVDQQVGQIVDAIGKSSRAARTVIAVHATNGEGLDEHDFTGHAGDLFEEAIRVPMIVAIPGGKPAKVAAPVSVVDLVPTLLDLAGAPREDTEGTSLSPALRGEGAPPAGPVLVRTKKGAALIDGPLKLMVIERKKGKLSLLYDLASDPGEKKDISGERSADFSKMLKTLGELEPDLK